MEAASEFGMLAEAVAVSADVDDVTVVDEPIDQGRRHDLIAEDLAPVLEAFVAGQDRRRMFIASGEELEEEHRPGPRDGEIADLVDDHQAREHEGAEAVREPAAALGLFKRVEQIGECREVDAPAMFRRRDGETEREVGLPDAGRAEEDDILFALEEAQRM
jgi:hypothetical protein